MTQETGCYIDEYRGQYAPQAMVLMSTDMGFIMSTDQYRLAAKNPNDLDQDEPELMDDLVQRAEDYLNANHSDSDHSWYWYDGSFGYWENDEEEGY